MYACIVWQYNVMLKVCGDSAKCVLQYEKIRERERRRGRDRKRESEVINDAL